MKSAGAGFHGDLNPLMGRRKRLPVEKTRYREKKTNKKPQKEKKSKDR